MKKNGIKTVLCTIAGLAALPAFAGESDELYLVEDLSVEWRAAVHKTVVDYLIKNPRVAPEIKGIAVDKRGTVYVLDDKFGKLAEVGTPSTVGEF